MEITEEHNGSLPELRQLCLQNLDNFTSIVGLNKRKLRLNMLNHLIVCTCKELKYLLSLYVLKDLKQLKTIDISDCGKLEHVFMDDEQDTPKTDSSVTEEALPFLHSIKLRNLPQLASICSGDVQFISRSLTQMTVENCANFIFTFAYDSRSIVEKSKEMIVTPTKLRNLDLRNVDHLKKMCMYKDVMVSFMNLTSLQLQDCNKLEYLFSLSMAQKLSSLLELMIISCKTIEQIVIRETEERGSEISVVFPQVETLILKQLPKFTGFHSQDGSIVKWLALAKVEVKECPKIQRSMLGMVDRPLLKNVIVDDNEDRERRIGHLFNLTDELSKLKDLTIEDSKQLKKYMEMDLQPSSFIQLKTFVASQCDNELNKFLSILLDRSNDLEQLTIQRCELLEQVFILTEPVAGEQGSPKLKFPNLKTMQLRYLHKLNCIWNKDPRRILELRNLVKLEMIECGLRKSPLSTTILEELVSLEELKIESCEMMEQVVEVDTQKQEISFPKLKILQLLSLPKLIKFNSGHPNFRFPDLLQLKIEKCPKLNVLSNQTLTIEGTPDHVPLNEITRACPNLKELTLAGLEMIEDVEVNSFSRLTYMWIAKSEKLKKLVVKNCSSLRGLVLPSNCSTLTTIKISDCNILEEICAETEQEKPDKNSLRNLKSIILENLPLLLFFSLETCEFSSLEKVIIVDCPRLETFLRNVSAKADNSLKKHLASFVLFNDTKEDSPAGEGKMKIPPQLKSLELAGLPIMQFWKKEPQIPVFQNLNFLKIMHCTSIKKLFTISVAEHLSVLKSLTLFGCVNMVQVLQGGGGISKQVFPKLETLVLKHLPILTSFCEDRDFDFGEFPDLKMVRVEDVPNMNTFVKQSLKTPSLKQVHVTYITKLWQGDLNETINYLHRNHGTLKDEVWESD